MTRLFVVFVAVLLVATQVVRAQSQDPVVWVQIEAQPNPQDGLQRAQVYARALDDVNGFALGNGWYGIVLGPYTAADAEQVLQVYRNDGLIPRDSYIVSSASLAQQFFPAETNLFQQPRAQEAALAPPEQNAEVLPEIPDNESPGLTIQGLIQQPQSPSVLADETPSQARQSERNLTREERLKIQTALQWAGFYNSAIDGSFGRGTRNSMTNWQLSRGFEPTGILTTAQRAALIQDYDAVLQGLGLRPVADTQTGIEIMLPTKKLALERYEAPFARFSATDGTQAGVLLISQPGDVNTLSSLYNVMQTLEVVPLDGPRRLQRTSFSLTGRNAQIVSDTRVSLENDQIKGFTLIWPTGDEPRRQRLLDEMQASFTRLPGVLNPEVGADAQQRVDLLAGLQVRQPSISRSGFFVDGNGSVVTTAEAVKSCGRITLDEETDANIAFVDGDLGVAFLTPTTELVPAQIARFSASAPRLQSEVAVSGYSYEGILEAPSMTFGTLADLRGLSGEQDLSRLALNSLPGDAGGPVFDDSGNVLGMLLPKNSGTRQLPKEVSFALTGSAIAKAMESVSLIPGSGGSTEKLAPEDITQRALAMTVLVSCWD